MQHETESQSLAPDGRPPEDQPRWRRDFPIDTAQDEFVARRDFVKFLVLTSAAFAAGQVWIGMQSLLRQAVPPPPEQPIIALDALPVGGVVSFRYPDPERLCLLVRAGRDTLLAYGQECTHLSCAVLPDLEHQCFRCPCHHGAFDLASGVPIEGPPRRPLPKILLQVRDGVVYAIGVELRT